MSFTKLGVVVPLSTPWWHAYFDGDYAYNPVPLLRDGRVHLYYAGYDGSNDRIGLAVSEDGVHFTKLGVVIPLGADGEFDDGHAYNPAPLLRDGRVHLYYAGHDGSNGRIGLAVSEDGV